MLGPSFKKLPNALFCPQRPPKNRDQTLKFHETETEFCHFVFEALFQHLLKILLLR